jgi:hypothetical protein
MDSGSQEKSYCRRQTVSAGAPKLRGPMLQPVVPLATRNSTSRLQSADASKVEDWGKLLGDTAAFVAMRLLKRRQWRKNKALLASSEANASGGWECPMKLTSRTLGRYGG